MFALVLLVLQMTEIHACGHIYLTQSPKKRNIQLNWNLRNCGVLPDVIFLAQSNPLIDLNATILHRISPGAVTRGYHETAYPLPEKPLPTNWSQPVCLDFYIGSAKNRQVLEAHCLALQPTWMGNFGELYLSEMVLPGTHNSGAWKGGPPLIRNYFLNQDRNLWEQLVYGIRYFDLRVGWYENGFYINHSFIKCTELLPELLSVEKFLRLSPKEVVILNFYRFPHPKDFKREFHLQLLRLLESLFGDLLARRTNGRGPKLKELWHTGRRVIVSYRDEELVREFSWLWPSVARRWGNKQTLAGLEHYIKGELQQQIRGNPFNVLMAELTPNYASIIKHFNRNLKDLAVLVNRDLTDWIREEDRWRNLNIIATDFFTGNDLINVAIESNLKKLNK